MLFYQGGILCGLVLTSSVHLRCSLTLSHCIQWIIQPVHTCTKLDTSIVNVIYPPKTNCGDKNDNEVAILSARVCARASTSSITIVINIGTIITHSF